MRSLFPARWDAETKTLGFFVLPLIKADSGQSERLCKNASLKKQKEGKTNYHSFSSLARALQNVPFFSSVGGETNWPRADKKIRRRHCFLQVCRKIYGRRWGGRLVGGWGGWLVCNTADEKRLLLFRAGRLFAICDVFLVMRHSSQPRHRPDLAGHRQQGEVKLINNSSFFVCFHPGARKPKNRRSLDSFGGVEVFSTICCGKAEKKPPSILWQSSNLIQNPAQHPQPPPSCAYRNPHTNGPAATRTCTDTQPDMCAHKHALLHACTHTQPGAAIIL